MRNIIMKVDQIDIRDELVVKIKIPIEEEILLFLAENKGVRLLCHELTPASDPLPDTDQGELFGDGRITYSPAVDQCECGHERRHHHIENGLLVCRIVGCECTSFRPQAPPYPFDAICACGHQYNHHFIDEREGQNCGLCDCQTFLPAPAVRGEEETEEVEAA